MLAREEEAAGGTKLHNKELLVFGCRQSAEHRMRMRNLCRSIEKFERKKAFERFAHNRRDNIKAGCKEIHCEDAEWIRLAEGTVQWWAFVSMAAKLWVS